MRYLFRLGFALALGLALMGGCSDENGEGASGGTGAVGGGGGGGVPFCIPGAGGIGGIPVLCMTEEGCDDNNSCTVDVCQIWSISGEPGGQCAWDCVNEPVENGTACSEGECVDGVCAPVGAFPCTEQGIRDAIAEGGGPHFFACDGPTTVTTEATIGIDNAVILDGEGKLTVDGDHDHTVFDVSTQFAELHRFIITGGRGDSVGPSAGGIEIEFPPLSGTLTVVDSTISDNVGQSGGGIVLLSGAVKLVNSTISDNAALGAGGVWVEAGSVFVINSTLSGNTGGQGDAVGTPSASVGSIALRMWSSTVAASRSGSLPFSGSGMTVALANTLLVDSDCNQMTEFSTPPDVVSLGRNIESPGDTCGFDQATDQVNVTAEQLALGPLADNGGPTMTHALGTGSVAIDQIPAGECVDSGGAPLTTDQRGEPRPGGALCDVGAFEAQP